MDTVAKVSDLLAKSWRSYTEAPDSPQGLAAYRNGLTLTRKLADGASMEALKNRDALLVFNMSWFNPLQKRYVSNEVRKITGPIVGIVAATNISPPLVRDSKQGAGSEIAVIEVADALARLGCSVYVFTNIPHDDWKYSVAGRNPQYLPMDKPDYDGTHIAPCSPGFARCMSDLLLREPGDVCLDHLIVWRTYSLKYHNFDNYAKKVHYWSHDVAINGTKFDFNAHSIYCLTEYHKSQLQSVFGHDYKYVIGCNGTMVDLTQPMRMRSDDEHYNVCYASNYSRGLADLLTIWPHIFKAVPRAKLFVYYGRETWGTLKPEELDLLVKKLAALRSFGVTEMCAEQMMPHAELLKEFSRMSILAYPYTGESETFSITSVAAQQTGVITAVRRRHGLVETCAAQPSDLLELNELRDYVIKILKTPENELVDIRRKHYSATNKYTWDNAAKIMMDEMFA